MTEPPQFHRENGTLKHPGDIRSSVILKHLTAYVLGAANVVDRVNNTINTVLPPHVGAAAGFAADATNPTKLVLISRSFLR
jgi:hypothetical protein